MSRAPTGRTDPAAGGAAPPPRTLDITRFVCPMTFVRVKLALEAMNPGERLEVRLNAGEPLENVPRSVAEMGHEVLTLAPEAGPGGVHRLLVRLR